MKAYVQGLYASAEEGRVLADGEFVSAPVEYDDWRIRSVTGPVYEEVADLRVEIWRLDYQLHTTTPENVLLAGGRYLTETAGSVPAIPTATTLLLPDERGRGPDLSVPPDGKRLRPPARSSSAPT